MQPLQISKTAAKCVFVRYRSCRNSRERALQSLLKIGCLDWELPGSCGKGVRRPRTMQVLSRFIYFLFFFSRTRKHVYVENAKTQVEKRKCAKCPKCERCAAQFNLKRVAGKKRKQKRKKSKFSHDQRLRQAQQSTRRPALPANRRLCSMYQQAIPQPCLHMQLAFSPELEYSLCFSQKLHSCSMQTRSLQATLVFLAKLPQNIFL